MELYWNQMGDIVYGSIENALINMIIDGESEIRYNIFNEINYSINSGYYKEWYDENRKSENNIRRIGGQIIKPIELISLQKFIRDYKF